MRRLTQWVLTAALLLGLAAPASAQIAPGPGFIITASRSSVTIANSEASAPLFTYDIPAGFAVPLHLRLEGTVGTADVAAPANLTCNYGGANASLTLLNADVQTDPFSRLSNGSALTIDFRVRPIPVWHTGVNVGEALFGSVAASRSGANASSTVVTSALVPSNGSANGTVDMTASSGHTISCQWNWGNASAENSITIWQGNLVVGE